MRKILVLISIVLIISCKKQLNIGDFEDEWGSHNSELRIEAIVYPIQHDAEIRIDCSMNIASEEPYDGVDNDGDGQTDEYDEILPYFHVSDCSVIVYDSLNASDILEFAFVEDGGQLYDYDADPEEGEDPRVFYGTYRPTNADDLPDSFWSTETTYQIECECPGEFVEYGKIVAERSVAVPSPAIAAQGENVESCLQNTQSLDCFEFLAENDTIDFHVVFNEESSTFLDFVVPISENINFWVSRFKHIGSDFEEDEFAFRYDDYEFEYHHEIYPLENVFVPGFFYSKEKIYVVEIEDGQYRFELDVLSRSYAVYLQFSGAGLSLYDPVVSNLRDQNGAVVMGVFGVVSRTLVPAKIFVSSPES